MQNQKNDVSVSVIVPIYNEEKYLKKCLDSILNQTLTNIEIILIDDGSTDDTIEICNQYVLKDKRVIYYRKANEGLAAARQDGMDRARGEYIGFVDSDDWLELNMYERMYYEAKKNDADIVFCNCYQDESRDNPVCLEPGIYDKKDIQEKILTRTLAGITEKGANSVIRWSNCLRIYRRELIGNYNIEFDRRFRRSQDLQLTFETTLNADRYVSINNEYLYHNRIADNGDSLSRGYTENYWKLIKPLIERLYSDIQYYQKSELMHQMHLCTFFFAYQGVINECEKSRKIFKEKIKLLREIIRDKKVQEAIRFVEWKKLNAYYRTVYKGFRSCSARKMYMSIIFYPIKSRLCQNRNIRRIIRGVDRIKNISKDERC